MKKSKKAEEIRTLTEYKRARQDRRQSTEAIYTKYMDMNLEELNKAVNDLKTTTKDLSIGERIALTTVSRATITNNRATLEYLNDFISEQPGYIAEYNTPQSIITELETYSKRTVTNKLNFKLSSELIMYYLFDNLDLHPRLQGFLLQMLDMIIKKELHATQNVNLLKFQTFMASIKEALIDVVGRKDAQLVKDTITRFSEIMSEQPWVDEKSVIDVSKIVRKKKVVQKRIVEKLVKSKKVSK